MIPGQNPTGSRPSTATAPQNGYRSYDPEVVYAGDKNFSSDRVGHEFNPVQAMITRANGGTPGMDQVMGKNGNYQSDAS